MTIVVSGPNMALAQSLTQVDGFLLGLYRDVNGGTMGSRNLVCWIRESALATPLVSVPI